MGHGQVWRIGENPHPEPSFLGVLCGRVGEFAMLNEALDTLVQQCLRRAGGWGPLAALTLKSGGSFENSKWGVERQGDCDPPVPGGWSPQVSG